MTGDLVLASIALLCLAAATVTLVRSVRDRRGGSTALGRGAEDGAGDLWATACVFFLAVYVATLVITRWGRWEWGPVAPIVAAGAMGAVVAVFGRGRLGRLAWVVAAAGAVLLALSAP